MSLVCRRFFITGKVQGVFFRASTVREAERLNITGWARNLADGRVEVLACGDSDRVNELAGWLEHGPALARVGELEVITENPGEYPGLKDFRTR